MSFLYHPEEEIVICSPMEGRITFNGAPAAGARIERLLKWKDDTGQTDTTITDENGYFRLPIIKEKAKLPKLAQFVVLQKIHIFHNKEYLIWTMGKMSKDLYGELDGKPINFRCELTDESRPLSLENASLVTVCQWDGIEQVKGD